MLNKVTPDPDDYKAIEEDEPDLKKVLNVNVTTAPRKAVEPRKQVSGSLTPVPQFPGRHGPPRPITGQISPTGEDQ